MIIANTITNKPNYSATKKTNYDAIDTVYICVKSLRGNETKRS